MGFNGGSNGDARVEPHLADFEGASAATGSRQPDQSMFEANALSKLIAVLDQANQDEPMQGLSLSQQHAKNSNQDSDRLIDLQDQVQMFETMGLKNEFQVSLRNYTVQVL